MRSCLLAILLMASPLPAAPPDDAEVDYNRDVRPILAGNCFACHGPDAGKRKAGLRLDTPEGASAKLKSGSVAVVGGKPGASALVERITAKSEDDVMPPPESTKKLTAAQIDTLRQWVAQGGRYQAHWAYLAPARPPPPAVKNGAWCRTPVDRFILARLEKEGLAPSPEADKATLVRRLSFDLTGLPPVPADVEAFESVEKTADRLLASPHFGERMALYWLDLVRFADSRGYHSDNPRNVGAYRDYVIRAFNDNFPFDRFTTEQLAGDLLPGATVWQRVASGYNKLNQTTEEGGAQAREYEAKTVADRVRNVSGVWMGATMGCCECHDHKFDPYTARDFYRFGAFFADIQEGSIGDGDKGIPVLDEMQAATVADLDAKIAVLRKTLDTPTPELERTQVVWEQDAIQSTPWTSLTAAKTTSKGKAAFAAQADGAVLVSGANPAKDTHTLEIKTELKGITAIRLEALADPSLPGGGPGRSGNGNFVLTGVKVRAGAKDAAIERATADHSQDGFPVAHTLDASNDTGWATLPTTGKDNSAIFELKEPLADGALTVILDYQSVHGQHVIGRFRLSATTVKEPAAAAPLPAKVRTALGAEKRSDAQKKDLAAHFRSISPLLRPARRELAGHEARKAEITGKARRSLVSMPGAPRTVRVLPRGNWLDASGEAVTPAVPAFLPPLETGDKRATRLDLAKWLTDRRNPLTARVFVNRLWKLFYGQGISKSLDDLGAQGEWPVHPELLDWLAVEFTESGWDVKRLVKLLVTSSAYRQTSVVSKELREWDPFNRLAARQSRFRHDAEAVRDNALALSGLLARNVGGDSVKPYQPKGYWFHLNFPKREWENDRDENAYRRGLYTWWQRTFMHPSLMAFDAPSREEVCAERPRSNIPQQALVLLNDPTYVEAARMLAARILKEGGASAEDRIRWAYLTVLSRRPSADEARLMADLQKRHHGKYAADRKSAEQLLAVGMAPAPKEADPLELASWTSVARTLLNLHETITRY